MAPAVGTGHGGLGRKAARPGHAGAGSGRRPHPAVARYGRRRPARPWSGVPAAPREGRRGRRAVVRRGPPASMVAIHPSLSGFLEGPLFEASPYSPASRLFWNELWIDPEAAPEFQSSTEARDLLSSPAYRRELARLGSTPLVDYRAVMSAKR